MPSPASCVLSARHGGMRSSPGTRQSDPMLFIGVCVSTRTFSQAGVRPHGCRTAQARARNGFGGHPVAYIAQYLARRAIVPRPVLPPRDNPPPCPAVALPGFARLHARQLAPSPLNGSETNTDTAPRWCRGRACVVRVSSPDEFVLPLCSWTAKPRACPSPRRRQGARRAAASRAPYCAIWTSAAGLSSVTRGAACAHTLLSLRTSTHFRVYVSFRSTYQMIIRVRFWHSDLVSQHVNQSSITFFASLDSPRLPLPRNTTQEHRVQPTLERAMRQCCAETPAPRDPVQYVGECLLQSVDAS